jgi:abortive infection bacteriophage resistance protein
MIPVDLPCLYCHKAVSTLGGFFVFETPQRTGVTKLKFTKPFLTYEEQADQLIARGFQGSRATIIAHLQSVSYYRLSGYWYPFRKNDPTRPGRKLDEFSADATIEKVWDRYIFDRRLRLLVMDAIERIEVDARTRLAYLHSEKYGPFGYAEDPGTLPGLPFDERKRFLDFFRDQLAMNNEDFVVHFRNKYGSDHNDLPIWMACELMTFGTLFTFYRGCETSLQKELADHFEIMPPVCRSWLQTLNTIRNICAHHARFWNRVLGVKPMIPNKDPKWRYEAATASGRQIISIPNDRIFSILTICRHCLDVITPGHRWTERLKNLLSEHPDVPRVGLGLIDDWEQHPLWISSDQSSP